MSVLRHHGLVAVPIGPLRNGIYWLRLFRASDQDIAVVTEIPGNPGLSVTNAISDIVAHLEHEFGIGPKLLVLFEIWPPNSAGCERTDVKEVILRPQLRWRASSRARIEHVVGGRLPEIPGHETLINQVRGMGGAQPQEDLRPVFEALPVQTLPAPHNPFRCALHDRFERMAAEITDGRPASRAEDQLVGDRFLGSLTDLDRASCPVHQARWSEIADESVRIVESQPEQNRDDYVSAAEASDLGSTDRRWLVSLFRQPVTVTGGGFRDGQHRACALRFSGADRAAVVTGFRVVGEIFDDWTYEGGG